MQQSFDNPGSIEVHKYFTKWETFRFAWPAWNQFIQESESRVWSQLIAGQVFVKIRVVWCMTVYTHYCFNISLPMNANSYNSQGNYSLACVSSETHNMQRIFHPGGDLPYLGYIGMCGAEGYVFLAVLVWMRVLISTIVVWNRVWFVPSSLQLDMFLEEATSSSFGDKTISLLMFTPTVYVP